MVSNNRSSGQNVYFSLKTALREVGTTLSGTVTMGAFTPESIGDVAAKQGGVSSPSSSSSQFVWIYVNKTHSHSDAEQNN